VAKTLTFKDLNITFKPHPITGDLIVTKDEAAIKQAVVNLLLTNKGERFFNANIGSSVSSMLFEPLDYGTAGMISSEIENTLRLYEPRINVLSVDTIPNFDENGFDVELSFEIIGREDIPVNVAFFLERTR
jgi:phage baseplate assembly protein W